MAFNKLVMISYSNWNCSNGNFIPGDNKLFSSKVFVHLKNLSIIIHVHWGSGTVSSLGDHSTEWISDPTGKVDRPKNLIFAPKKYLFINIELIVDSKLGKWALKYKWPSHKCPRSFGLTTGYCMYSMENWCMTWHFGIFFACSNYVNAFDWWSDPIFDTFTYPPLPLGSNF